MPLPSVSQHAMLGCGTSFSVLCTTDEEEEASGPEVGDVHNAGPGAQARVCLTNAEVWNVGSVQKNPSSKPTVGTSDHGLTGKGLRSTIPMILVVSDLSNRFWRSFLGGVVPSEGMSLNQLTLEVKKGILKMSENEVAENRQAS